MKAKQNESTVEQQVASDSRFAQQMGLLLGVAQAYPEELAQWEFGPDKTLQMANALTVFKQDHQAELLRRGTRDQRKAVVKDELGKSLKLRKEIRNAFLLLGKEDGPPAPPVPTGESLRGSALHCLAWMAEIRPSLVVLNGPLSAFMKDPLGRFDAQHAKLLAAVTPLRQSMGPDATRSRKALLASRAALVRLARLLRFSGRLAFAGQPELIRSLSQRAGQQHRRAKAATEAAAQAGEAANAEAPKAEAQAAANSDAPTAEAKPPKAA